MVVVTGGAGFVGSHLVEGLLKKGFSVRVIDNLSTGRRDWIADGAEFVEGDITSLKDCRLAIKGASAVFHLAAMSRAAPSNGNLDFCIRQNVIGTQNVLEVSRDVGVKKVIYAASSTVYGSRAGLQKESDPPDCQTPYALSKWMGEQLCHFYSRHLGLSTLCLRYFSVYGPRQPETGPYSLVFGIFLNALKKNKPLQVHGTGSQCRDFIHVEDVVEATIKALDSQASGMSLNVGSGQRISIKTLADLISLNQTLGPSRENDSSNTQADLELVHSALAWSPQRDFRREVALLKDLALKS